MENQTVDMPGMDPALQEIVPGTMSGAEMIAFWEREGVFEAFDYLNDLIGPGKKYADSTEYVQAMRQQAAQDR